MDFDVFLSHNSKDKPSVRALAQQLKERDVEVWLDEDQLIPGRNWQPLLERGIEQSSTGAVLVGKDGLGPWENEEMEVLLRHAVDTDKPVIPVLLPGSPKNKPKLPLFLSNRTWVDLREGFSPQGIERLVWGIKGEKLGAPSPQVKRGTIRRWWGWGVGTLAAALLIGVMVFQLNALPEQVLAGSVRDEAGDPIAGIEVSLPAYGVSTVTNDLGRFELRVRAPHQASAELLARAKDYATHRQYVMLGTERLGFKMQQRRAP